MRRILPEEDSEVNADDEGGDFSGAWLCEDFDIDELVGVLKAELASSYSVETQRISRSNGDARR